jgi:hypothetical protein
MARRAADHVRKVSSAGWNRLAYRQHMSEQASRLRSLSCTNLEDSFVNGFGEGTKRLGR